MSQEEIRKQSQEEALKRILEEYPEFTQDAMDYIRSNEDLTELLSILDSFY